MATERLIDALGLDRHDSAVKDATDEITRSGLVLTASGDFSEIVCELLMARGEMECHKAIYIKNPDAQVLALGFLNGQY